MKSPIRLQQACVGLVIRWIRVAPLRPAAQLKGNVLPSYRQSFILRDHRRVRKFLMKPNRSPSGRNQAIFQSHIAQVDSVLVIVISAGERPGLAEIIVRWIPHLSDRVFDVADASIYLIGVVLPKSAVGLPA